MAWIETIAPEAAEGPLKREYDETVARSGAVANVVSLSSLNPGANETHPPTIGRRKATGRQKGDRGSSYAGEPSTIHQGDGQSARCIEQRHCGADVG